MTCSLTLATTLLEPAKAMSFFISAASASSWAISCLKKQHTHCSVCIVLSQPPIWQILQYDNYKAWLLQSVITIQQDQCYQRHVSSDRSTAASRGTTEFSHGSVHQCHKQTKNYRSTCYNILHFISQSLWSQTQRDIHVLTCTSRDGRSSDSKTSSSVWWSPWAWNAKFQRTYSWPLLNLFSTCEKVCFFIF